MVLYLQTLEKNVEVFNIGAITWLPEPHSGSSIVKPHQV